jgi:N-acetylmuramoyl-L-alanine amidase
MRRVHVIRTGWIAALIGLGGLAAIGAAASAHGAASQGDLLKVRFGGDENQTRIVVEMSRSAQAKLISGGQPLVLELPRIDLGAERQGRGLGLVRAWSADTTAGAARIKLDMAKPAENRAALPPLTQRRHHLLPLRDRPQGQGWERRRAER